MNPEELIASFANNSVAARDWVKGKKIEMTYSISSIGNNAFGGERAAIAFQPPSKDFMSPGVEFWFDGSFRQKIGQLHKGDTVTCVGTFSDVSFDGSIKLEGIDLR